MATSSNQFRLKLRPSRAYNITINWGDGTSEVYNSVTGNSDDLAGITHTYATSGIYNVTITENVTGGFANNLYFNGWDNGGATNDDVKITSITSFGTVLLSSFESSFEGCLNLSSLPTDISNSKTNTVTNFNQAWQFCPLLSSFPLIDTSKGTQFVRCWGFDANIDYSAKKPSLKNFPLLNFNEALDFTDTWALNLALTSFPPITAQKVTNFTSTWDNCRNLKTFSEIVIRDGSNFTKTWIGCISLTSFPLINFSKGQNFTLTWANCPLISSYPLFNTASATSFEGSFFTDHAYGFNSNIVVSWTTSLTTFPEFLAVPGNTKNVTSFKNTWRGCRNISNTDNLSNIINNSKATNVAGAWHSCHGLTSFPSDVMLSGVTLFGQSSQSEGFAYDSWNNSASDWPIRGSGAWAGTRITDFPLLSTQNGTDFSVAWYNNPSLSSFPLLNIGKGIKFVRTWSRCIGLSSFPGLDFRAAYQINGAWAFCGNLTSVNYIELSACRYFGGAWSGLNKIKNFPSINTLSATSFYDYWRGGGAWQDCFSLSAFPLLNTSNCSNFKSAWQNCYSLSATPFPQLNMAKMKAEEGDDGFFRLYEADDGGQCGHGGRNCFAGVRLWANSYSSLLTSICATNPNNNVIFHGGNSFYTPDASAARAALVARGWTITDGGLSPMVSATIATQPVSATIYTGGSNTFTISAFISTGLLSYQWRRNNLNIANANNPSYSATELEVGNYTFDCLVGSSVYGSTVFSTPVTLSVMPLNP